ncbi:PREDICTED: vigilin [Nicrophorus vespilloides]|uniref:Vigilin n=1 Tax=Nicrophorus vespilloides TaxID=110193 RepID=A0ABM1MAK1_NICVS|nr:PREDICTED: vigilin [Nicrophorus vespilloides]
MMQQQQQQQPMAAMEVGSGEDGGGGGGVVVGSSGIAAYEQPSVRSYDDLFPALPESAQSQGGAGGGGNGMLGGGAGGWNAATRSLRVGTSVITQVFRVPFAERKLDNSDKFGEGESLHSCGNIMKETGAHIEISAGKDQSLTFLVSGKHNEVLEARRKILSNFQTQASKNVSIPKEHHRWILGKKGDKLKELEKLTATKITVPSMNDPSENIVIVGPKEGIEKAEHEIRVTSDEQSKKAFERVDVPKIFHPFVVGAFGENLAAMIAETGARINVPPQSVMKDEIVIAGDKDGVAMAKAKIEAIHEKMKKCCNTVQVEVPKSQHKYVIGPRGSTIAEILRETGVSVEMPPSDSATDTITLRGPHDRLGPALGKVYEKANSVRSTDVQAPSWIHKYIIGRKGASIKEITQNYAKVHVEFNDKESKIKIEGPPEEVEKVHERIDQIARDYVARYTFTEMKVDQKFYKHIIGKSGVNVNRIKDEAGVAINIEESGQIRIEGVREGVEKAQLELEELVCKLENEKERDVIIDQRHYRSIIGTRGENIKEIRERFNQVQISFPGPNDKRDVVKIRGLKNDVDQCYRHMQKVVKELNESSFQIEVPIFKQFHKFIIGKGGANIRKIREETQTKIDLPAEGDTNDVITITGKKENVEEAREKIRKIQDELETIVTEEIVIDPKFYNSLIGSRGKLIHSIMEDCGGVAIKFPSAESRSDKVTIRGPKEDVDRAKQQLLDLASERQLSSYTAEVRAKAQHHKFLIGKSGANIKKLRDATGARIVFPSGQDEDRELITIIGKKEAVLQAKEQLEATIREIDNITESEITVDPKHHKYFVARRGEILHRISDECGGVTISFPRSGVQGDKVVLKGAKDCIEATKLRILEHIADLESMVTLECIIPQQVHRTVMGAKGYKVQGIVAQFDVQIKFPDKSNTDEYTQQLQQQQQQSENEQQMNGDCGEPEDAVVVRQCDVIRITGKEENCRAARQALLDLRPITIDVQVPFDLHRSIIGKNGRDVKELMDAHDVHIVLSPADQEEDRIKITGTPQNTENAREAVLAKVAEIEIDRKERKLKSFALQMEVNPDFHPKIIGKRGAVITKIRADHDVQITFPKRGDPEEHIIKITGYEENTYRARDDIMKIVNELNDLVKEEVNIDPRVHSRLIGTRGRSIRKIMDDFKVDIKFPRSEDANPSLVIITGPEENVLEAKDHLLNLEEEYMQDVSEQEMLNIYRAPPSSQGGDNQHRGGGRDSNGFVVAGGPWEQQAPNTDSVTEFPSFGGRPSEPPQVSPIAGAWGNRR